MEKLVDVIKLLADKYSNVDVEIEKDVARLRVKGVQDVVEVSEKCGQLHVKVLPSCFNEDIDLARLEDIINILNKQANYKSKTYDEIQQIKKTYARGTKIKLTKMYDIQGPRTEMILTVNRVDDAGTIYTKELGLGIVVDVDEFVVLGGDKNG